MHSATVNPMLDIRTRPSSASRMMGTGMMPDMLRAIDWSITPLGSTDSWSEVLVAFVNQTLHAPQPVVLLWGPELTMFYNEAAIPTLGTKSPRTRPAVPRGLLRGMESRRSRY